MKIFTERFTKSFKPNPRFDQLCIRVKNAYIFSASKET